MDLKYRDMATHFDGEAVVAVSRIKLTRLAARPVKVRGLVGVGAKLYQFQFGHMVTL